MTGDLTYGKVVLRFELLEVVKVRMFHRFNGRNAFAGFVDEHALKQIVAILVQFRHHFTKLVRLWCPFGKCTLKVFERRNAGPSSFCGSAQNSEDAEELINFGVGREKSSSHHHFSKNTTDRPDINRSCVLATAKKNFGSAVPKSDNLMSVRADRHTEGTSQTKVGKFQGSVLVNEQILRFEITVKNSVAMAKGNPFEKLPHV
mmetsp:Transcript_23375/g.33025  ORF Transcript_23375/g.33025 Transcript_23375/m.33025 type:complete len:203 (+) Transcript_23375:300-908(+)